MRSAYFCPCLHSHFVDYLFTLIQSIVDLIHIYVKEVLKAAHTSNHIYLLKMQGIFCFFSTYISLSHFIYYLFFCCQIVSVY
ncbi:unnamed protein product [Schistosoma mattheei]|uniref:Uncharacterized protein n=1 Tax=Schistosoma mattheei TaxID=31246 RepID=A0A183PC40_9TREM|nr:unnamed protein product [Schistosoma mattheei]